MIVFSFSGELHSQNTPCEDIGITESLNFITTSTPAQITPGDDFCIDFTVENFTAINTFQFTFTFDPTLLEFVSFTDNQADLIDRVNPNTMQADNGIISLLWFNFATTGLTLPDGTLAFTICFKAQLEASDCVPLTITDALSPTFASTEVNYQIDEDRKCQSDIVLFNGDISTCVEIECTSLAITDVGSCNTTNNSGSIHFSACGGIAPYQIFLTRNMVPIPVMPDEIQNDFDRIEYNNMPTGVYQVLIIDRNGDSVTRNFIIENIPPVSYDPVIVVDPICANLSNGSITIENLTSGFPGELFDIGISTGVTFQDVTEATITRLQNGEYTITITDTNGCETEETVVLDTPPIELDIQLEAAACFGAMDGSIMATATGGTPFPGNEYEYNNVLQPSFTTLTPFEDNAFNNLTNRYRLRVEDSNGCTVEENIEVPVAQEIEVEITDIQDVICKNEVTGSLTLNVLSPGRFTFLVFDEDNNFITAGGNNGQSLFYNQELAAGRYEVTIRDTSGCAKDTFFEIMEPAEELTAVPDALQASCNSEDGTAILEVNGGMGPYSFVWADAPGIDNDSLVNVLPGTYEVTVTDDLGCMVETSVEVLSGEELEIEAFIADNLECDGTGDGQLDVTILNSSASDHNFEWTNEMGVVLGNNSILPFNAPGTYIVNVMAVGNDCEAMDTIEISATPGLSLEITTMNSSCSEASDGSAEILNITGGIPPYTCNWEDTSITSCNPVGLSAGIYNVTISDSDGCEKDTFVTIMANELNISLNILAIPPSCAGETDGRISINNIMGGTAPYECVWEDNSITSCDPTQLEPGRYNFSIVDANGCSKDTFAIILEAVESISYDLDIVNPECGGDLGSITIDNLDGANLPIDVSWSVAGASGLMATGLLAGNVTISFEDGRGCMSDTTVLLINEDTNFQLTIDATPPDCAVGLDNGSISFPGFDSNTGTCVWDNPDLNAQNCTLIGLSPGVYFVTLTNGNGCQKDTFIDLSVPDRLELEVDNIMDISCFGGADGSATATVINNPMGVADDQLSYFWTNPNDNGTGASDDANQLGEGVNTVYVFDGLCTSDTVSFTINEPEAIVLNTTQTTTENVLCFGECTGTANLQAEGGSLNGGDYSYAWEDGFDGAIRTGLCAGKYLITITDDNLCEFVDSIIIDEPELLELGIDSALLVLISCGNDDTGSLTVLPEGGCGNYTFEWTDGVSTTATANNLSAGTYEVTVTDGCGCTAETSFEFESSVPIDSEALVPEVPQCEGDRVCIGIASVSGGTGSNYTYSVNFGSRIDIDSCTMVGPGTYTLLVFDSAGCSDELSVTVASPPDFEVELGEDIVLDFGENMTSLSATTIGGDPVFLFDWFSDAEIECLNTDCSSINVSPFTNTTVEVLATDSNGCTAEDDINISIKTERNVYLPNVFNPDALPPDNRFMILTGRGVEEIVSFRIFDRWGNLVYEEENIPAMNTTGLGWDGRRGDGGNNKVEQGVYVYTAEVRFVDNVSLTYRGQVTLVR